MHIPLSVLCMMHPKEDGVNATKSNVKACLPSIVMVPRDVSTPINAVGGVEFKKSARCDLLLLRTVTAAMLSTMRDDRGGSKRGWDCVRS